jgi:hypothetical protein
MHLKFTIISVHVFIGNCIIATVRAKKNAIKDSYEKESAVSLIKKFVMHLWNPEMGYLNKQL